MNIIKLGVIFVGLLAIILPLLHCVILIFSLKLYGVKKDYKKEISSVNIPYYFEEMYQELYSQSNIGALEILRKKARNRIIFQILGFCLNIIAAIIYGTNDYWIYHFIIGWIFIILGMNKKYEKQYKLTYKKEIINKFIKQVSDKLEYETYNMNSELIKGIYKAANFDNKLFNIFEADDYITGLLEDNINIQMSDLNIKHRVNTGRRSRTYEVFQGIFVKTECNKDIGTYIKISKNQLKIFGPNNRVEMDSAEFEKYFDIYSENEMITMQLLTSDVMTTLIDFYNKYSIEYEIVIRNDRLYMRFFTGAMFEPKVFGNSMDKELLLRYYCILKFIIDVTKEVNKALKEVEN